MIKVQDWIASIPDGEKHIAYVGESMSETREFLFCGEGWETYQDWSFHLDMAFDPESITSRDSRQVVQTHTSSTETKGEEVVDLSKTVTQETYTVEEEEVLSYDLTDVASLAKAVKEDGIHLTWTVLRHHALLPGKLWATLRAVDSTAQMVKKSAIMVFEVDASIAAVPAARPAISEMEQIEARVAAAADAATADADRAEVAAQCAMANATNCQENAAVALESKEKAAEYASHAEQMYNLSVGQVSEAAEARQAAADHAAEAQEHADAAAEYAAQVEQYHGMASDCANAAEESSTAAKEAAASAAIIADGCREDAGKAVDRCSRYALQCEGYAMEVQDAAETLENLTYRRVNVRDYGAVGDGVADDREAIIAAFEAAKTMLPCEVYFPAGTYGISNGITVEMELGTGGLRVCGAGRDITTITYLDSYNQYDTGNMWYAIRIWPVGRPDTIPDEADYLHDISYTGLTVYDPDPIGHALSTNKGDTHSEETHGFDIHCCKGVSVTDCQFITVGDEAIDICFCHDVVVMNNRLIGSPAAGITGGAISIGDGCKGVVVCGNTVNGSAPDETLDDGTVITKNNVGISVECLEYPVQDVTITGNTIRNINGKGVNLSANANIASLTNVVVADNVISGCKRGVNLSGALSKDNVKITNNIICDILEQAIWTSAAMNLTICGNTIRNIKGNYAIHTATLGSSSRQFIANNVFENIEYGGVYCHGNVVLKDCVFNGLGTAETEPSDQTYGVYKAGGVITVSGCVFKDVRMFALKSCLQEVDYIDNTDVEVVNKTTGVVDGGGVAVTGSATKRIIGGSLFGRIDIKQDGTIVQGAKIVYAGTTHAVTVSANRVSIVGCVIENNSSTSSYKAINETSGYNYNLFANNIVNRSIVIAGAQSMAVNNIDTRVTA